MKNVFNFNKKYGLNGNLQFSIKMSKFDELANCALELEEKKPHEDLCGHMIALVDLLISKKPLNQELMEYRKDMISIVSDDDARQLLNITIQMKKLENRFRKEGIHDINAISEYNDLSDELNIILEKNQRDNNLQKNK